MPEDGNSAYGVGVFGPNPADCSGWGRQDPDLLLGEGTWATGETWATGSRADGRAQSRKNNFAQPPSTDDIHQDKGRGATA